MADASSDPREIWTAGPVYLLTAAELAARREAQGFSGMGLGDSQNRYGDPFIALALAAERTTRLKLATSVANPVTRHPAAMAAAIASVHELSGGRATLGIGSGDSALAYLGVAPAPVATLQRYVMALRTYLSGGEVPFDVATSFLPMVGSRLREVDALDLGDAPAASRLQWLDERLPPARVAVWGTGPRTIDMAARTADEVTFSVGADPSRVRWAIDRATAAHAGVVGAGPLDLGAAVQLCVDEDRAAARAMISGIVASHARFAVMYGSPQGPVSEHAASVMTALHDGYDMRNHSLKGSVQDATMTDEFVDYYAIVGPPGHCVERIRELFALGLRRLHVSLAPMGADPDEIEQAHQRFSEQVISRL